MTPLRCGLNPTTSNTRGIDPFVERSPIPARVLARVLPCNRLAWFPVFYLPACGLHEWVGRGAKFFVKTVSRWLLWRGLSGSDESLQADETVVGQHIRAD